MNTPEWIGFRDEDLTEAERTALELSPELKQRHLDALQLGQALGELPKMEGPTDDDLWTAMERSRAPKRPPAWGWLGGAALLAAVALLWIALPTGDTMRDRGMSAYRGPAVHLEAVAESSEGLRPLRSGDTISMSERIIFRFTTEGSGTLVLEEALGGALQAIFQEQVAARRDFMMGGDTPLSYRPDHGLGTAEYTAWLCPDSGTAPDLQHCSAASLILVWEGQD